MGRVMIFRMYFPVHSSLDLSHHHQKNVRFWLYITKTRFGITEIVNIGFTSQKLVYHHFFVNGLPKIGSTSLQLDIITKHWVYVTNLLIHHCFLKKVVYLSLK